LGTLHPASGPFMKSWIFILLTRMLDMQLVSGTLSKIWKTTNGGLLDYRHQAEQLFFMILF
jgi:hypothetical protein